MSSYTYRLDAETRSISFGERADGTVYVTQVSEGDLTEMAYDAMRA